MQVLNCVQNKNIFRIHFLMDYENQFSETKVTRQFSTVKITKLVTNLLFTKYMAIFDVHTF